MIPSRRIFQRQGGNFTRAQRRTRAAASKCPQAKRQKNEQAERTARPVEEELRPDLRSRDIGFLDHLAQRLVSDFTTSAMCAGVPPPVPVQLLISGLDLRCLQRFVDCRVELGDDRLRESWRRRECIPGVGDEVLQPARHRWDVRSAGFACRRHREDARLPTLVQAERGLQLHEDQVDVSGDQIVQRGSGALVGDVDQLGARELVEQFGGEVRGRPGPCEA